MTAVPVPNTRKGKQAARRERVAAIRAQQQRAERCRNLITLGVITAAAAVIIGAVAWYAAGRSSATAEAIPPGVGGGTPLVQPAALVVPNTSGIGGVVAYDTAGWRAASHNGPAARALPHRHVNGPVQNRYGFSENFEIVDRLTGLPRGVTPLSGGETFLASLALALGLVELAQRGGGRLDALFLDEGASAPWTRTDCPRRLTP